MTAQVSTARPTVGPGGPPSLIRAALASPALGVVARVALASPFLISGLAKLLDFAGAQAEAVALGLSPPVLVAAAVIATQLGGTALFLTRGWCWLGAGILAGFTVLATLIAHPFWAFDGPDRARQTAIFFEHVAIVGGFAAAAAMMQGRKERR
jgi:uncharacterized membrane protein YphA (DoxX/SURF4 family)